MSSYKEIAKLYRLNMKMNLLPLKGKKPMIDWEKWQVELQSENDLENMYWDNSTGIGGIQGWVDIRNFDIDGTDDFEIVELILDALGLTQKYCWVVKSGSEVGFHIYFRAKENPELLNKLGGIKAVYKFNMKKDGYCHHLELRWKNCQTALPPSMHESGGIYKFYFDDPKDLPEYVELEKVIECLEKYCVIESEKTKVKSQNKKEEKKEKTEKIYYDKARLESALDFLSKHLPDSSYEDWYKIGFGLVPLGKDGEKYFVDMSLKNPNYKDSENELVKKFETLVKDYDGRVTIGTIYHLAELYGWKKPLIKFWYKENDHRNGVAGRLKISRIRFKRFLESEGFCKYKLESNHLFVRIENNIVEEIDGIDVKEFVMTFLNQVAIEELEGTNRNEIIDTLIKSANQLFTQQFLEFLDTKKIEFNKDTIDKGYLYFKNGFVEVSSKTYKIYDYTKLDKHIWKKQIINRNFSDACNRSVFEDFLFNICRSDVKRFNALKSGIGYLLHTYKNPSITKAVVFIDEKLSDGASGRSGKGVVIKAVGHIRNVVAEDGRNFNPSKNFAFQRVKADTNVIGFEDIREKFPFERLFSIITDGITIERKNKDEIHLGYNESPKVVISTNFSIVGVDDSTLDRQFIVEFSDYYNMQHRPVDDFGKSFFDVWNESEWRDFDNLMISCLQLYLRNGLISYEFVNIEKKKMIDETSQEFVEFANDGIEIGKEYEKKELWENFKKEYEDFEKLTQSKFTRWLKVWGKVKNYEVVEGKSGSKRTINFKIKIN
ncbi:MAG: PriCT-2 domain-containing protein [Ignavibacteriae bacterium]|nr:PriCT-2 domain-containing protein [Ignavibacteriota bacterium]